MRAKTDEEIAADVAARCAEIGRTIATQDNLATKLPMFIVQTKRRISGIDEGFTEEFHWVDGDGERVVDEELASALEVEHLDDLPARDGYDRVGYVDVWEFVTACFTRAGAENYIAANGHNLIEPRIYVETGFRNREWETVRDHLLNMGRTAR